MHEERPFSMHKHITDLSYSIQASLGLSLGLLYLMAKLIIFFT
jgi:hypothetical protein